MKERIAKKTEALLENDSFYLVDIVISGGVNNQKVKILLDGDQGITIDDCAKISRSISGWMDEENLFSGKYTLEVSSPGVDHPLKLRRQYYKNLGRRVKAYLTDGTEVEGVLTTVNENRIVVEQKLKKKEKKMVEIPFENLEKVKVLISFKRDG
ncbi:MAG: ribosome maturation factor RimP [Cyclobacteriaceae bacterium]